MGTEPQVGVLHVDPVTEWRGGQQQIVYLFERMLAKGWRTEIVCQPESRLAEFCRERNLPFFALPMRGEFDLKAAFKIACHARHNNFRILHLHSAHALTLGIWAKLFNHNLRLIAARRVDFSVRKPLIGVLKYNNRLIDRIVCVSENIKRVLISDGVDPQKLTVIHSGVDLHKFDSVVASDLKNELGIPGDHLVVGTIAALAGHKDYPTLLRAAKQVIERFDKVTFCAVGDGAQKEKLLALHWQLHLGQRFMFLGFRSDVGALLKMFDIFALTSHKEGLGTSVLDAMIVGLPVVATSAGGIPEMIEHGANGLLITSRNDSGLAAALLDLLNNAELRKRLGQAAQQSVQRFDISETVAKTLQLYQSLLSND